jgi:uncharacterized protein (TIGR00266 family)
MKYEIQGENLPVVICQLEAGETMVTEGGSMAWMSPNMSMGTTSGGFGKALGRLFSGESMFQNTYTAQGGPGVIAFASKFPGAIKAVEITPDKPIVVQKSAFLAGTRGVDVSVFFQRKMRAGFFGGEGFIMQKISGRGLVFLEIDGSAVDYDLEPGQQIVVASGNLAMMDETCSMDVQAIAGIKNVLFGGEGLFNTVITGPGRVTLQTMPLSAFAELIARFIPTNNNSN